MKKTLSLLVLLVISVYILQAGSDLSYFLPVNINYNNKIPTPEQFTGYEVGKWHITPDRLIDYMIELAKVSDRAVWEEYGRSYEDRALGQLIISSPENIKNIEELRKQHLMVCDPSKAGSYDIKKMPLFVKLGYGIHGNEASGPNSSVLAAYYLVAGEGKKIDELLKNTVILIDPTLNPDGMQRFSTWVNSTKSLTGNPDPNSREFREPWPGGRSNHYWFDLNRDYIMLQNPESTGRMAAYYRWRPDIVTDQHEMGANSTFFFQPGVQSRDNPLTPLENQQLTAEIARYHEEYLDSIGSLYYSEEGYDDYYVGKGSSYPDIHGSVGILFEQAGVKGHIRKTPGGIISFPFAIRNQFLVSLSTLEAGLNMRTVLLESLRDFYTDALSEADKYPVKAYVFSEPEDNQRVDEFIKNLLGHHIKVFRTGRTITREEVTYDAGNSYIVPLKQPEYRFIRSLFEPVHNFTDSIFYDVSTWVMPMAFNISYTAVKSGKDMEGLAGEEVSQPPVEKGKLTGSNDPYAYLFEWNEYLSPKALYELQDAGIIARVATKKFAYRDSNLNREFSYGTILVPATGQVMNRSQLHLFMQSVAGDCGITVYGVSTGLTPEGIDLGSTSFAILEKPSVLMFVGDGISSSDAGEIWHMFDTRFSMPVTMIHAAQVDRTDIDKYNVIIVAGSPDISSSGIEKIKRWNHDGGILIAYESGNRWLSENKITDIAFVPGPVRDKKTGVYAERSDDMQAELIPGSIFKTKLDLTHPLCYGYVKDVLPVFKSTTSVAMNDRNIYNNPVTYTSDPLLSGYCTRDNIDRINGSSFASVHGNGIISIYDDTNFRAIWYGTSKIFMNAVFFGQLLRGRRY